MNFDDCVGRIIANKHIDHFSALEVRTSFLALKNDPSINGNDARRFVYSELLKLVKKGWLRKVVSKKKEISSFIKTEHFDAKAFDLIAECQAPKSRNLEVTPINNIQHELFERLNDYKNELLISLGETDEYKNLYEKFPEFIANLQPKYDNARDNNSRFLGKIKALENLIQQNHEQ
jgi:uncharacterized coiled-coil DUF342 family protein